jgi:SPX domain protein involved in polyphosphate accumulation
MPDYQADDEATVEEIFAFLWQYDLRPVSIVRYERQAFVGTDYDVGLRVTFDTSLSFQSHQLDLHEQPCGLAMLSANLVVMEIKVNERIPYWLTEMLAAHDLQITRISKYCRSIEAARSMPSRRWRSLAPQWSQDVLSSIPSSIHVLEREVEIETS